MGAIAGPIALRKARPWLMLLRVLLIRMTSTTPWRTFVPVLMLPSLGTCRRSLMPRLLVLFLVRPDLLLGLVLSSVVAVTIGRSDTPSDAPRRPSTRLTGAPPMRLKRQRAEGIPYSTGAIPEDFVAPGFRYPPQGGIRPRYPVIVEISDTPLLTNLLAHPSSLVRRCQVPAYFHMSPLLLALRNPLY